ncbi:MAG TPA: ABC-type transport auxiliary lipoprotein family protein [Lysobacter sp.]
MNASASIRAARIALASGLFALAGCASLLGGRGGETTYAPLPAVQTAAEWPAVPWQLLVSATTSARVTDSQRIVVRPQPHELQVYKDASWAKRPTDMLEETLIRTLEDSGRVPAVARPGSGVQADYRLVLDLRRFESDYAGGASPAAVIEVNAKLLHVLDERVIATRTFTHSEPAGGTAVPQVVAAFERALAVAGRDIAGWTLGAGAAHERGMQGEAGRR